MPAPPPTASPHRVVFASSNPGKIREVARLVFRRGWEVIVQSEFGVEGVEESASTFVENALLKARAAAAASGLPAIADDSGLMVDALGGAPGVRSARFAGEGASDEENVRALLSLMEGTGDEGREARFVCVVVYLRDAGDPTPLIGCGAWRGRILRAPRGREGFGYDPVFLSIEHGVSAAEMSLEAKNACSHRAKAFEALLAQIPAPHSRAHAEEQGGGTPEVLGWGTRIRT